jgi:PilZ domain
MMRDLSAEGFALRAVMPVPTGEQIPFSFSLNANARIEGHGEILWVEEQGRVAGIRFVDLPTQAQALIQHWVDGTLETGEPEKPAIAEAPSFEELREELRAPQQARGEAPQPKPHWALRLPGQPEPANPDTENQRPARAWEMPQQEEMPASVDGSEAELAQHNEAEHPYIEPVPYPGLPHFTTPQEPVEIQFEALPEQRGAVPPTKGASYAGAREEGHAADAPELPDISDILIQPPLSAKASRWPPLDELNQEHTKSTWTEWFTLSRAVGIMTLLALAVGFSVYHQAFGEGLIWLGQQLAGSTATQAPAADVANKPSSDGTNSPEASTSSAVTGTSAPSPSKPAANPPATRPLGETVPSLPETTKSSSRTAGAAPTGEPDSGQETGSSEYARALQLLHDKNRDADLSEAVRLLWISVEKGNPSAELALAELYWRGEGVARNCDQARILLSAAARKGNADAGKRLRQFEREGCE